MSLNVSDAGDDAHDLIHGSFAKVGPDLARFYQEYQAHLEHNNEADDPPPFRPGNPTLRVANGYVTIDATAEQDAVLLRTELDALGLTHGAHFGRMVSGRLPIAAIAEAAALESLRFARAAVPMRQ